MGYSFSAVSTKTSIGRYERHERRRGLLSAAESEESVACTIDMTVDESLIDEANDDTCMASSCQTDMSFTAIKGLESELQRMTDERDGLREAIGQISISFDFLKNNNSKLKFYTGIQISLLLHYSLSVYSLVGIHEWPVFYSLFQLVEDALPEGNKLTKKDIFVMFFLKIRLNLTDEDIGDRYGVHKSTVSRHFHQVLDVMHIKCAHLICWPDRETLRLTMPTSFRKFFKSCCVIVDCTEIFIERPSDLLARAQVWSNYKHHSTIKFLIGISPQGTISFLSHAAGGRMSDKDILESSGLTHLLLPGRSIPLRDCVMVMTVLCHRRRNSSRSWIYLSCLRSTYHERN